jgi:sterol desaturase/sphingolipid hydroxylase (fatty acid hydroxylase superfamily)
VSFFDPTHLMQLVGGVMAFIAGKLVALVLSPGTFSLASLVSALCVAILFLGLKRRGRPLRLRVLLRALFPRRLRRSRSTRADVAFFFFSFFLVGILFGWAVMSMHMIDNVTNQVLSAAFGVQPARLSGWTAAGLMTAVLFVAYELGYWIDHYLSHNVPFLWEFHKVHHTAEVLSPLTNFRVHPIDTIVFNNILAGVMGVAGGLAHFLLGRSASPLTIADSNVIVLAFFFLIGHLQHTHFWIAFTGPWGRIILSPAHHQIHHSTDPAHFNKNLGSFLAIWDWMFGTLCMPSKARQKLDFGVEPKGQDAHTVRGGLVAPVLRAASQLTRKQAPSQAPIAVGDRSLASGT